MVSVAVLVIPWLLSRPGSESNPTRSAIVALSAAGEEGGTSNQKLSDASRPVLVVEPNAGNDATPDKTPPAPATASGGWVVRVGTFSKPANADSVATVLANSGFTAHKVTVKTTLGGDATRIWLGPYAKKETAGEVSERLKALTGERGFITKHAP